MNATIEKFAYPATLVREFEHWLVLARPAQVTLGSDPHVHFHVIPRYSGAREWDGLEFADHGWPGPPNLKSATQLSPDQIKSLRVQLAKHI
jgi:hypothetical protein